MIITEEWPRRSATDLGGDSGRQGERGVGVSKIVQSDPLHPVTFHSSIPFVGEVVGVVGSAIDLAEHEILVGVADAESKPITRLCDVNQPNRFDQVGLQADRSPLAGLCCHRSVDLVIDGGDRASNRHLGVVQVDVRPREAERLASPTPGECQECPRGPYRVPCSSRRNSDTSAALHVFISGLSTDRELGELADLVGLTQAAPLGQPRPAWCRATWRHGAPW